MSAIVDMTEREWTTQVVELARMFGWSRYHTYRSDRSAAGWPDEALVRDRLILLELKTEKGRLSEHQRDWIRKLVVAAVETYVARPSDLQDLGEILAARERPTPGPLERRTRDLVGLPP